MRLLPVHSLQNALVSEIVLSNSIRLLFVCSLPSVNMD